MAFLKNLAGSFGDNVGMSMLGAGSSKLKENLEQVKRDLPEIKDMLASQKGSAKDSTLKFTKNFMNIFSKKTLANIKSDIKSGRVFGNAKRGEDAMTKAFLGDDDMDFDFDDGDQNYDVDIDMGDTTNNNNLVINNDVSPGIMDKVAATFNAGLERNTSTLNEISTFNTEETKAFYTKTYEHYEIVEKCLTNISDTISSIYHKELLDTTGNALQSVFGGSGIINVKKYLEYANPFKYINEFFEDYGMLMDPLLAQAQADPLGVLFQQVVPAMMPKELKDEFKRLEKNITGIVKQTAFTLSDWKEGNGDTMWKSVLGGLFGIDFSNINTKIDSKSAVDYGNYQKGAVAFDGVTRKAIVQVIPQFLSQIASASENIFRYMYSTAKSSDIDKFMKAEAARTSGTKRSAVDRLLYENGMRMNYDTGYLETNRIADKNEKEEYDRKIVSQYYDSLADYKNAKNNLKLQQLEANNIEGSSFKLGGKKGTKLFDITNGKSINETIKDLRKQISGKEYTDIKDSKIFKNLELLLTEKAKIERDDSFSNDKKYSEDFITNYLNDNLYSYLTNSKKSKEYNRIAKKSSEFNEYVSNVIDPQRYKKDLQTVKLMSKLAGMSGLKGRFQLTPEMMESIFKDKGLTQNTLDELKSLASYFSGNPAAFTTAVSNNLNIGLMNEELNKNGVSDNLSLLNGAKSFVTDEEIWKKKNEKNKAVAKRVADKIAKESNASFFNRAKAILTGNDTLANYTGKVREKIQHAMAKISGGKYVENSNDLNIDIHKNAKELAEAYVNPLRDGNDYLKAEQQLSESQNNKWKGWSEEYHKEFDNQNLINENSGIMDYILAPFRYATSRIKFMFKGVFAYFKQGLSWFNGFLSKITFGNKKGIGANLFDSLKDLWYSEKNPLYDFISDDKRTKWKREKQGLEIQEKSLDELIAQSEIQEETNILTENIDYTLRNLWEASQSPDCLHTHPDRATQNAIFGIDKHIGALVEHLLPNFLNAFSELGIDINGAGIPGLLGDGVVNATGRSDDYELDRNKYIPTGNKKVDEAMAEERERRANNKGKRKRKRKSKTSVENNDTTEEDGITMSAGDVLSRVMDIFSENPFSFKGKGKALQQLAKDYFNISIINPLIGKAKGFLLGMSGMGKHTKDESLLSLIGSKLKFAVSGFTDFLLGKPDSNGERPITKWFAENKKSLGIGAGAGLAGSLLFSINPLIGGAAAMFVTSKKFKEEFFGDKPSSVKNMLKYALLGGKTPDLMKKGKKMNMENGFVEILVARTMKSYIEPVFGNLLNSLFGKKGESGERDFGTSVINKIGQTIGQVLADSKIIKNTKHFFTSLLDYSKMQISRLFSSFGKSVATATKKTANLAAKFFADLFSTFLPAKISGAIGSVINKLGGGAKGIFSGLMNRASGILGHSAEQMDKAIIENKYTTKDGKFDWQSARDNGDDRFAEDMVKKALAIKDKDERKAALANLDSSMVDAYKHRASTQLRIDELEDKITKERWDFSVSKETKNKDKELKKRLEEKKLHPDWFNGDNYTQAHLISMQNKKEGMEAGATPGDVYIVDKFTDIIMGKSNSLVDYLAHGFISEFLKEMHNKTSKKKIKENENVEGESHKATENPNDYGKEGIIDKAKNKFSDVKEAIIKEATTKSDSNMVEQLKTRAQKEFTKGIVNSINSIATSSGKIRKATEFTATLLGKFGPLGKLLKFALMGLLKLPSIFSFGLGGLTKTVSTGLALMRGHGILESLNVGGFLGDTKYKDILTKKDNILGKINSGREFLNGKFRASNILDDVTNSDMYKGKDIYGLKGKEKKKLLRILKKRGGQDAVDAFKAGKGSLTNRLVSTYNRPGIIKNPVNRTLFNGAKAFFDMKLKPITDPLLTGGKGMTGKLLAAPLKIINNTLLATIKHGILKPFEIIFKIYKGIGTGMFKLFNKTISIAFKKLPLIGFLFEMGSDMAQAKKDGEKGLGVLARGLVGKTGDTFGEMLGNALKQGIKYAGLGATLVGTATLGAGTIHGGALGFGLGFLAGLAGDDPGKALTNIGKSLSGAGDWIEDIGGKVIDGAFELIGTVVDGVLYPFNWMVDVLENWVNDDETGEENEGGGTKKVGILNGLANIGSGIWRLVKGIGNVLLKFAAKTVKTLYGKLLKLAWRAVSIGFLAFHKGFNKIVHWFDEKWEGLKTEVVYAWDKMCEGFRAIPNYFLTKFFDIIGGFRGMVISATEAIEDFWMWAKKKAAFWKSDDELKKEEEELKKKQEKRRKDAEIENKAIHRFVDKITGGGYDSSKADKAYADNLAKDKALENAHNETIKKMNYKGATQAANNFGNVAGKHLTNAVDFVYAQTPENSKDNKNNSNGVDTSKTFGVSRDAQVVENKIDPSAINSAMEWAKESINSRGYGNNGCTTFTSKFLEKANNSKPGWMYVPNIEQDAKASGIWKNPSMPANPGDIVVLETNEKPWDGSDHVVIATGDGNYIGNSSGRNKIWSGNIGADFGANNVVGYVATGNPNTMGTVTTGTLQRDQAELIKDSGTSALAQGGYIPANNPQAIIVGDNTEEGEIVAPVSKIYNTVKAAINDELTGQKTEFKEDENSLDKGFSPTDNSYIEKATIKDDRSFMDKFKSFVNSNDTLRDIKDKAKGIKNKIQNAIDGDQGDKYQSSIFDRIYNGTDINKVELKRDHPGDNDNEFIHTSGGNNIARVWNFLTKGKYFRDEAAAGILGNFIQESHVDPTMHEGFVDKGPGPVRNYGFGLAQWTYPTRQDNLVAYADKYNKPYKDLDAQLNFMNREMRDQEGGTRISQYTHDIANPEVPHKIMGGPADYALLFHRQYENSIQDENEVRATRGKYAEEIYKRLAGAKAAAQGAYISSTGSVDNMENLLGDVTRQAVRDVAVNNGTSGSGKSGSVLQEILNVLQLISGDTQIISRISQEDEKKSIKPESIDDIAEKISEGVEKAFINIGSKNLIQANQNTNIFNGSNKSSISSPNRPVSFSSETIKIASGRI